MAETSKKHTMDIVQVARKRRHLLLLEKMRNGRTLGAAEARELERLESGEAERGRPSRLPSAASSVDSEIVVGHRAAARFAEVSERTLQRWENKGLPSSLRGRKKTYRKNDLELFAKAEKSTVNPSIQREQLATADIKETKAKLSKLELEIKLGEWLRKEDVETRSIAQITELRRAHKGLSRNIMPFLRPFLKNPETDIRPVMAIIDNNIRQMDERFANAENYGD